jgi:archaellum component FlaC
MNLNMISMNHLICVAIVFTLVGCKNTDELGRSSDEQIEALKSKVRKLEEKIDHIESQFGDVTGSVLKLGNEIEDFSSENWKKNVPEVEYEFELLRQAVSDVQDGF